MTGLYIGLGILGVVLIIVFYCISVYNGLITLRNRYKNAYSQIDVQLKRRYDLIPNLVETAKGYMKHERETLESVTAARNAAAAILPKLANNPGDPELMKQLSQAEGALNGALSRFSAVAEAYPDLKASQNMMQVQEELTSTENKVAFSRQAYNDSVMVYNTTREKFPANIVAGFAGFGEAQLFEVDSPLERQAPKVSFS